MKRSVIIALVMLMTALLMLHYGQGIRKEPREVEREPEEAQEANAELRASGGDGIYEGSIKYPPLFDDLPESHIIYTVEEIGDYLFASTSVGVQIFDSAVADTPVYRGELRQEGYVLWFVGAISDTIVVAVGDPIDTTSEETASSIVIAFDIDDIDSPVFLGSVELPGVVVDGAIEDTLLFATVLDEMGSDSGLHVVDISDPENPEWVSLLSLEGAHYLAIGIDQVFVSGEERPTIGDVDFYVRSISVTNPMSPTVSDTLYVPDAISQLSVSGSHILVASDALRVIDAMTPTELSEVASRMFVTDVLAVQVYSNTAYLAFNTRDAQTLDVSRTLAAIDISIPTDLSNLTASNLSPGSMSGIEVSDGVVFVATEDDIVVHNASDPELGRISQAYVTRGWYEDARVGGEFAYAVDRFHGLRIFYLGSPPGAQVSSTLNISVTAGSTRLAINGDYLYVASEFGLATIDVSDPSTPTQVNFSDVLDYSPVGRLVSPRDMHIDSDTIYMVAGSAGVLLFDIANGADPLLLSTLDPYSSSVSADIENEVLFVVDETGVVSSTNVLSPSQPIALGVYATGEQVPVRIIVDSTTAYVYGLDGGVVTIDVTNPALMSGIDVYVPDVHATHDLSWVDVSDGIAVLATRDAGLQILDVSIPGSPEEISIVPGPGFALIVNLNNSLATVVSGRSIMRIDLSVPASPSVLWYIRVSG